MQFSQKITARMKNESINKAINMPNYLLTDDGRKLELTHWEPIVGIDNPTITIELIVQVRLPLSDTGEEQ